MFEMPVFFFNESDKVHCSHKLCNKDMSVAGAVKHIF